MKRILLTLSAAIALCNNADAQNLYGRFGLSYGIVSASQTMDGTATPISGSTTNTTVDSTNFTKYQIKKASFSTGLWATVAAGYMVNENFGFDLAAHMGVANQKYTYNAGNVKLNNIPSNVSIVQQAEFPILVVPSMVLKTKVKNIKLYTRMGVVLPLSTSIIQDQIYTNLPGLGAVQTDDYNFRITNYFSVGFEGATGIEIARGERMKFWAEASFISLSMYAREANLQDVSVDGQSGYLSQIPVNQRKISYSADYSAETGDYFRQPTFSQPFSNFSVGLGVSMLLESDGYSKGKGKGNTSGNGMRSYRNR